MHTRAALLALCLLSACGGESGPLDAAALDAAALDAALDAQVGVCGDGIVDEGERCDGDCPIACDDGVACTLDTLVGAAAACDARCASAPIEACVDGDGCCADGCDVTTDDDCSASCGAGVVQPPETCDGDCPIACDDGVACTADALVGSASSCSASCSFVPIDACVSGDGCCAPGCDATRDDDCSASCGNGVVEPPETCDGDCPTSCSDGLACTTDTLVGSASTCSASCSFSPISACVDGDGCCAPGCDATRDDDCSPSCGNGVTEPPELCDGDCPASCDDMLACTRDTLVGSASSCSATCSFSPISACVDGDGCCAPGCDATRDDDCSPSCGNGVTEPPETCDGDCPGACDDMMACTQDTLVGSASSCSAMCSFTPISACADGDGCCPAGCDFGRDDDCTPVPPAVVLVNEVLYDAVGADADGAFIELHGPPGTDLSGYAVVGVNGSGAGDYATIPLSGTIPADGLFVIAHTGAVEPLRSIADLLHAGADLQNGPDSVQVRFATVVVDALGYGDFSSATFAGEAPAVAAVSAGESLSRDAMHTDTDRNVDDFAVSTPSPGLDGPCAAPEAPRPTSPLSTSRVTNGDVPFAWALPAGHEGARVEICADRACASVLETIDATGASATPASTLPAGNYYWRAFGRCGGTLSPSASPVWQVTVAAGSRATFTSWNQPFDVNGDFHADAIITQSPDRLLRYYEGNTAGLLHRFDLTGIFGLGDVDAAGDVNGDGFGDALVLDSSGVRIYLGGATGLAMTHAARPRVSSARDVAGLGDVDGDGYADFGAISISSGSSLHFFRGGPALPTSPSQTISLFTSSRGSVSPAGDVDGDGYADVLVTNCSRFAFGCDGDVFLYFGGPTGLAVTPGWSYLTTGNIGAQAGGDVNGDGYADVVVGDFTAIHLFHGGPAGPSAVADRTRAEPAGASQFGWDVTIPGDLNGDGFDDVLVGDPATETVWLYWGPSLTLASTVTRSGEHDFGEILTVVGDVEADGLDDVFVSAPDAPMPATWESVWLFSGTPTGIRPTAGASQVLRGTVRNRSFGRALR